VTATLTTLSEAVAVAEVVGVPEKLTVGTDAYPEPAPVRVIVATPRLAVALDPVPPVPVNVTLGTEL
jgi:hypothetical protein